APPSPGSPTTTMPGRVSRKARSPSLTTGWSSTTRILMSMGTSPGPRPTSSAMRHPGPDRRARPRRGEHVELAAEGGDPLPHGDEPEAPGGDGPGGGIEP